MTRTRTLCVSLLGLLLAAGARTAAAEERRWREALAELGDMGPAARAALPELAALVDQAERLRRVRYGGSANLSEARRERQALGQALEALLILERSAALEGRDPGPYRQAHLALVAWIDAGIRARVEAEDEPGRAPRLATTFATGRPPLALVEELPGRATVSYGLIPAALQLMLELSAAPAIEGGLSAGRWEASLARAGQAAQVEAEVRGMARELARARSMAGTDLEAAAQAAGGEASPERLLAEQAEARARAERLEAELNQRVLEAPGQLGQLLGAAVGDAWRQVEAEGVDPRGALARRARGPYLMLVFVDGLPPDVIDEQAAGLPFFARLRARSARFERSFGVFPSVTMVNTIVMQTGALPERTGVPSNAVFQRDTRQFTWHIRTRTSRQVDDAVPVPFLHELFPERDRYTPLLPAQRGVESHVFDSLPVIAGAIGRRSWPDGIFLHALRRKLRDGRPGDGGQAFLPPRCMTLYLGWYDHVAHDSPLGPRDPQALAQLRRYDQELTRIEGMLEGLGIADQTHWVLVSDHGMYVDPAGQGNAHVEMDRILAGWGLPVNRAAREGESRERVPETVEQLPRDRQGRREGPLPGAVADVSGNGTIGLYFRHRAWDGAWAGRNLVADLRRYRLPEGEVDLLTRLAAIEGVDQLLAREGEHAVRVMNPAGEGLITWEPGPDGTAGSGRFAWRVERGEDPLALGGLADGVLRSAREWLAVSAEHPYPAAPFQVAQAFAANRDLDVTLTARPGWNFAARPNHLIADHGPLSRAAIRTTLWIAGPGVAPGVRQEPVLLTDLLPTLAGLSGVEPGAEPIDGRSLVPLLGPGSEELEGTGLTEVVGQH